MHMSFSTELAGFTSSFRQAPPALANHLLMKEFESTGHFWLPGADAKVVWGKLRYEPGGATSLMLDGNLSPDDPYSIHIDVPEIHGRLFNGAPCVLRGVWGGVETFLGEEERFRTRLYARQFLFGLDPQAPDRFRGIAITFSHLNEWFERPIQLEYQKEEPHDCRVHFCPAKQEASSAFRDQPFKLNVFCVRTMPLGPDSGKLEFTYQYRVDIVPEEPQTLEWHLALASLVRDLFIFLIGTGVYTLELQAFAGDEFFKRGVHIFPHVAIPVLIRLDPHYFYSTNAKIGAQFEALLRAWLENTDKLSVIRNTISDLLTIDGTSPQAVFTRVVQTLEHFHGLVFPGEHRYVPQSTWRGFVKWLGRNFPNCWEGANKEQTASLWAASAPLISRIGGINSLSFRSRIRSLFEAIPANELMLMIDYSWDSSSFLDEFLPRLEATRNYLTHFSPELQSRAFIGAELEAATLRCWSILVFTVARFLGLPNELAGDLGIAARKTLFLVRTDAQL